MPKADFVGTWRIEDMDLWEQDALDIDGPAFIKFTNDDMGEFGFVSIRGGLDCRYGERDGHPLVEFSWAGQEDARPVSGRGWAMLRQNGQLVGRIFIHCGDDSGFVASRQKERPAAQPRRARRSGPR